jgi:hypothetical protein
MRYECVCECARVCVCAHVCVCAYNNDLTIG